MAMRDWLTKEFGWKIFSLSLAVVIWLTIHKIREEPETPATPGVENTYGNLTVLVVSSAGDVRDFRVAPDAVAVTVGGPANVMAVLQAKQIRATVDLTGLESGHDLRRRVDVSAPPGVTLINVEPPEVDVVIPPQQKK
jgi:YbbR domain-containing protein